MAGKLLFPSLLWKHKENSPIIYLTFDDGPIPQVTPWVLSLLKEYDAKATFFCIGDNIKKHPEIFQQVLAEGHSIGNHTFNHLNGWKTSTGDYIQNVLLAEEEIFKQVGNSKFQIPNSGISRRQKTENRKLKTENLQPTTKNQKLFRPPYGRIKPSEMKELKRLGYTIVMWDVISEDYNQKRSEEKCFQGVVSQAGQGSIIVFHDSKKASKNLMEILPRLLDFYKNKGYSFKAL
ncbi:polysaccharide deacetylase family protein [Antarcticibacterium sp. 1MA-6-2]|uniref:polysaccharide deacetylase family protein n=1 Tax=Antarcticibacterium sp. 1MA-6-2 TaxID=2908210 RepID=UPI001F3685E8|nr:polysaccharide deacetylase family protein [Antarcticibacterium sp. 1MA-6-2]UJH90826.1 polysaccharide deacetylase family protein [Antarcticibacterium sp. 1MA-6-2]